MKKKENSEDIDPYEVLKGRFADLTYRLHGICDDDPRILTGLIFDLVDDATQDEGSYFQDDIDGIKGSIRTIQKIEGLLDLMEERSTAVIQ